jgi:hypothetical protein
MGKMQMGSQGAAHRTAAGTAQYHYWVLYFFAQKNPPNCLTGGRYSQVGTSRIKLLVCNAVIC